MNQHWHKRIMIVDDDAAMRDSITDYFSRLGNDVICYANGKDMLHDLEKFDIGVIVCDLKMPNMDGMAVLKEIQAKPNSPPLIMMTAHGDVPTAVKAIQAGAFDFIEKPFDPKMLKKMIGQALANYQLKLDNVRLRRRLEEVSALDQLLVGQSEAISKLRQQLMDCANTDKNILLVGESGVDKNIISRLIHQHSVQVDSPFVSVNCKVASGVLFNDLFLGDEGAFTKGEAGIIFLDKLDYLPDESQYQLLSLLEKKFSKRNLKLSALGRAPRLIGATNQVPNESQNDTVLNKIYAKLDGLTLYVPALRERADDVFELFNLYLKQSSSQYQTMIPSLSAEDIMALSSYDWPGNQHQLKLIAERFVLLNRNKQVSIAHLLEVAPAGAVDMTNRSDKNLRTIAQDFERQLIIQALIECTGNISQVCELLKIPRRTLNEKLLKHKLNRTNFVKN